MINLGGPTTGEAEARAVRSALLSGTVSTGEIVAEFESDFADFTDRTGAAAVCSGSVALELALEAVGLRKGDRVVVSPFNCGAVLYSLVRQELEPVYVDIDPVTYNQVPSSVEEVVDRREVEAILACHLYGQPADMEALTRISTDHDVPLIEDFAQAPGAVHQGTPTGAFGNASVCSFGGTKNITTGEGGIVTSNEPDIIDRIKQLRSNTESSSAIPLRSVRMSDIAAAIGKTQLADYDEVVESKRTVAAVYRDGLPREVSLPSLREDRSHVYHGFPIRTDRPERLQVKLADDGIETGRVYDTPLYEYPVDPTGAKASDFPETAKLAREVLLLPIHGKVTPEDAKSVVASVTENLPGR